MSECVEFVKLVAFYRVREHRAPCHDPCTKVPRNLGFCTISRNNSAAAAHHGN